MKLSDKLRLALTLHLFLVCYGISNYSIAQALRNPVDIKPTPVDTSTIAQGNTDYPKVNNCKTGDIITLDFANKCFTNTKALNNLKRGDFYQIKIININPNLYKISIGVKDTSKLIALPMPTIPGLGASDLAASIAGLSPLGKLAAPALPTIGFQAKIVYGLDATGPSSFDKQVTASIIDDYAQELRNEYNALMRLNQQLNALYLEYNKRLFYNRLDIYTLSNEQKLTSASIGIFLDRVAAIQSSLNKLNSDIELSYTQYVSDIAHHQDAVKEDELKVADDKIKAAYQKLSEGLIKTQTAIAADSIQKYLEPFLELINNSARSYTSLPIQFTQSQSRLRISIAPWNDKSTLQSYRTELAYPINDTYFWGVSSGFYISRLRNQAYSTKVNALNPARYDIVQENPGEVEFGVSAMVRYGRVVYKQVGWQLGFGPALAVADKVRPRIMVGIGPTFGENHKLVVDFGAIFGYVDRLSNAFTVPGPYDSRPDNVTASSLGGNYYIALHYLFFKQ